MLHFTLSISTKSPQNLKNVTLQLNYDLSLSNHDCPTQKTYNKITGICHNVEAFISCQLYYPGYHMVHNDYTPITYLFSHEYLSMSEMELTAEKACHVCTLW